MVKKKRTKNRTSKQRTKIKNKNVNRNSNKINQVVKINLGNRNPVRRRQQTIAPAVSRGRLYATPIQQPIPPPFGNRSGWLPGGARGADGIAGARGADGIAGARGADGNAGARGADGIAGTRGADGNAGARGADGIGLRGERGERGFKGDKGDKGESKDVNPLNFKKVAPTIANLSNPLENKAKASFENEAKNELKENLLKDSKKIYNNFKLAKEAKEAKNRELEQMMASKKPKPIEKANLKSNEPDVPETQEQQRVNDLQKMKDKNKKVLKTKKPTKNIDQRIKIQRKQEDGKILEVEKKKMEKKRKEDEIKRMTKNKTKATGNVDAVYRTTRSNDLKNRLRNR